MEKTNYYDEIIAKVDVCLTKQNLAKALEILTEELKMPYIPQKYENEFKKMVLDIQYQLQDANPGSTFSLERVMEMLFSKKESEQIVALDLIKNHNLRPVVKEMKKRIETFDKNVKKAFLFEILADQQISIDIKIANVTLNTTKDSLMNNQEVIAALKKVADTNDFPPQVIQSAMGELNRYLLLTFPTKLTNGNELGQDILTVVNQIITSEGELNSRQIAIKDLLSEQ